MSLPADVTYTVGSTTYVVQPTLVQIVAAVQALCVSAGHSDWLPAVVTKTVGSATYVETPKLADFESALRHLGVNTPADVTYTVGNTSYSEVWKLYPDILAAVRSLGG